MYRTAAARTGLVLSALLALGDLSDIFQPDNPEPTLLVVVSAILGVITLVGAVPAWRANHAGAAAVIVSRLLSACGVIETFAGQGFSRSDRVASVIALVVTLVAVGLVAQILSSRRPVEQPA